MEVVLQGDIGYLNLYPSDTLLEKMRRVWNHIVSTTSHRCNHKEEDDTHILKYKADGTVLELDEFRVNLKAWFDSHSSCSGLSKVIMAVIKKLKTSY